MQVMKFLFELRIMTLNRFKNDRPLPSSVDVTVPPVARTNREKIGAGGKALFYNCFRYPLSLPSSADGRIHRDELH